MATPSLVTESVPRGRVAVVIELDPRGEIIVRPDPFWIHLSEDEEVEWFCSIPHDHNVPNKPCFTVEFKGNSPFHMYRFEGHRSRSGCALNSVQPHPKKLYKYTVTVGDKTVEPAGGIKA